MRCKLIGIGLLQVLMLTTGVKAGDNDLSAGAKLYGSQCMVCHGQVTWAQTDLGVPARPERHLVNLEVSHFSPQVIHDAPQDFRIAVAPPYGPNLRGILGRVAGTAAGFNYSNSFLQALSGMEWTEAALDVWITDTRRWVPGVTMFYKQPEPQIRREIILYLKANP
jgi:cytochrome c2